MVEESSLESKMLYRQSILKNTFNNLKKINWTQW